MESVASSGETIETATRVSVNARVQSYLLSYCTAQTPLNYAVLLSGPWGSGKTFFLKKFLKKHNVGHIYVSLYGVASVAEIEQKIFAQLHPLLASKGMQFAGILARGLVKGALKIDLGGDGKDEGSLSFSLPDVKLAEFAKDAAGRVLVFDDLERASMKLGQVLGFINAFVEHESAKAIIVANESQIDPDADFYRIKEKLIGQTLRVVPSIAEAYPALTELIEDAWTREFVKKHEQDVLDVFSRSLAENLRVLKQALWDFERLAKSFRASDKVHAEALTEILKAVLALSIEVRTGKLGAMDLDGLRENRWLRAFGTAKDQPLSPLEKAESRYIGSDLRQSCIDPDLIKSLLVDGYVDASVVHKSLDRISPFVSIEREAAWRRAWYGYTSSDDVYQAAMVDFKTDLQSAAYSEPGEILHAFGVLVQAGVIAYGGYSMKTAIKVGKAYVDRLSLSGKIPLPIEEPRSLDTESGFAGLGFLERENPAFVTLRSYYESVVRRKWMANLPTRAAELINLLPSKPSEFAEAITLGIGSAGDYWNTPILHLTSPQGFVDALMLVNADRQGSVLRALNERLSRSDVPAVKSLEIPWLKRVRALLIRSLPSLGAMSKYRLMNQISTHLNPLVEKPKSTPPSPPKRPPAPGPGTAHRSSKRSLAKIKAKVR